MALFFPALVLPSLLIVFSSYILQLVRDSRSRLPPGPWPLPLLGNLHQQLGHMPHHSLARLAARHGPLMTLRLGTVLTIVASSPDMAREILQTHNADIAARPNYDVMRAGSYDENSVLTLPPRHKWRTLRRLCTAELFSPQRLRATQALRQEKVAELIGHVSDHAATGAPVDVGRATSATMLGLMSRTLFSTDLDPGTVRELSDIIDEGSVLIGRPNVSDFYPVLAPADLQGLRRRMTRLVQRMCAIIDQQIRQRERSHASGEARKNDMLDVMLDKEGEVEEESTNDKSHNTIRGLFADLLNAGGSASHAVECALAELLQSPDYMRRVQEELKNVIGTKQQIDETDISMLPYLQAVVKETLRLHPPISLTPYEAEATVDILGYTIPKGAKVLINIWAINRCPNAWVEPEKFMPERFLGTETNFMGRDFQFIPFGAGRRICLGMPLASRMVHLMLASLLHRFRWTLPAGVDKNGVDMTERFGLAMSLVVSLRAIAHEMQ